MTTILQRSAYEPSDVRDVMWETWWNNGDPAQVISVIEGIATLPSAAQAHALFAKFPQQWLQCKDGRRPNRPARSRRRPLSTTSVSPIPLSQRPIPRRPSCRHGALAGHAPGASGRRPVELHRRGRGGLLRRPQSVGSWIRPIRTPAPSTSSTR